MLARWRERDVFAESLRRRRDAPPWGFYEGPPTANGAPGTHHVLSRVFKDIFPRYRTMRGHYVERKGGWDCHGLPVELAVEAELGMQSKEDIERFGIAEFNARCREKVLSHVEDWNRLTERIGFWIDLDDAYRTLDPDYIESVWWALEQIHAQGLLYEKLKVVPYCTRCGTALSSHELGQPDVYRDVVDPSVYVRLPVTGSSGAAREGDELIVWTTTPWTLVSNAAVAVDPELTYVRARVDGGPVEIVAESLVERVLGEGAEVLERFAGSELVGAAYEPPFAFIPASEYGDKGHTVLPGDFVTDQDGTGLVHTAIAFGEDDFRLGEQQGLNVINPVRLDGTYDARIGPYEGRWVKDADPDLIEDLRARGRLLRSESYEHSYPHCWRCHTPLLYYAKPSWYIATSERKDRLLAANETVNWHPEHVKHGRFGNWLEGNVDWALSRERYWGTPLPVWRCANGHDRAIGSFAELRRSCRGSRSSDPHRPFVDEVTFPCAECGETMQPRCRGDRRLVRLGLDAVRPVPLAARRHRGVRAPLPGRLRLRGAGSDARLVLLAARDLDAAVRPVAVPQRRLPRADPRRRRPQDVQVAGQHRRALGRDQPVRRRRAALVLLHLQAAVGRLPLLAGDDRRGGPAVPAAAVEHVRVLRAVRQRERDRASRAEGRRADRARPVGAVADAGDDRDRARAHGRVRRDGRRTRDRDVRRGDLKLVRAPLAPALLGRRPGGVRDPARVPADRLQAAGAVLPVHRRRALRQPRRLRAERAPVRLPGRR